MILHVCINQGVVFRFLSYQLRKKINYSILVYILSLLFYVTTIYSKVRALCQSRRVTVKDHDINIFQII